jgi:hypothetical protein
MEKRMEPLTVSTKDGQIWIEQSENGEDCGVMIAVDQVPILVKWLQEAAAELHSEKEKVSV